MNHISYSEITREPYVSNATIIWCVDCRFEPVLNQFCEKNHLNNVDLIKFPGGTKTLAKNYDSKEFQLFAGNIAACTTLHQQSKVILTNHASCGAYSLENKFNNDDEEKQKLTQDLKLAKTNLEKFLKENHPDLKIEVELVFVGLEKTETI